MRTMTKVPGCRGLAFAVVGLGALLLAAHTVFAHCDTTGGPVIAEARTALEKGDVTPVLKWVGKEDEAEIKTAFAKAVAVRAKGPEAQDLADTYFLETLVRLHRAGEGEPYTGIKDEPVKPIVALADKALSDGSPDEMIKKMSEHLGLAVREKFSKVQEAAKNKDKSVEAGREFVAAYVTYMHYIEGVRDAIMSAGSRHQGDAAGNVPAAPAEHKEH